MRPTPPRELIHPSTREASWTVARRSAALEAAARPLFSPSLPERLFRSRGTVQWNGALYIQPPARWRNSRMLFPVVLRRIGDVGSRH
ncbi:hypothetical protein BV898_00294 [Hypsibius exemplaris]|uniref:Uncharacterized protein n=1 Tax=Hypsibius exemplaris TaxID=2072580 RepID=A0A1W0XFB8_HYPEX|nr:hypothetical protein BV898_00294 [Hypsibius exemplaris]